MSEVIMDAQEIKKYLPHRYPFLLIDRVIGFEAGKSLVAYKNVSNNEEFFNGHFPVRPVMPGVLMIEALAQAGAVLAYKTTDTTPEDGVLYYLAGVNKARFKRVVVPGDQLHLEVAFTKSKGNIMYVEGKATVEGELACSAEIVCFRSEEGM